MTIRVACTALSLTLFPSERGPGRSGIRYRRGLFRIWSLVQSRRSPVIGFGGGESECVTLFGVVLSAVWATSCTVLIGLGVFAAIRPIVGCCFIRREKQLQ